MGYVRDCKKIMLCKILLGRVYKTSGCLGAELQTGYDSHMSQYLT